jgi:LacI family transcriptional regulator
MGNVTPRAEAAPKRGPGGRPIMREVAERAGVALSSVSRVLSGHPDVSPVMRNRVLDAVAALHYQPNLLAQSLRTGETRTIGFLVADISNPLMSAIAVGAEVMLRKSGYAMLLTNSFNEPGLDARHVRLFQQRRVDGLLLSLSDEAGVDIVAALEGLDLPAVLVDRQVHGMLFASVVSDHKAGIRAAVTYLFELGHRHIALINDNRNVRPSRERANALRRACRGLPGMTVAVRSVALRPQAGYLATKELLAGDGPFTALIAGSNQILVGVLPALRDLGMSFPADVSLVTCDDFPFSDYLAVTTVSRDTRELGEVAAGLLLEQLAGGPARRVVLPTSLRVTDSCAPPAKRRALVT